MLHGFVGFLIPGSKSSAYDQDDWILTLARVIRQLHEQRRQLVGVCFGHQLIAHALGGTVRAAYENKCCKMQRPASTSNARF
jgi:GMP synthase-like glutamine amidotransferase